MAGKMARPTRTPQTQCPPLIRLVQPSCPSLGRRPQLCLLRQVVTCRSGASPGALSFPPPLPRDQAPPLDFDFRNDGGPFVAKAPPPHKPHGDSKDRRHAVQCAAPPLSPPSLSPSLRLGSQPPRLL